VKPEEQFAKNLRAARLRLGYSQEALAERCQIHATEVSRLERAVREPRLSTIVRLSKGLGVSASDLLADV